MKVWLVTAFAISMLLSTTLSAQPKWRFIGGTWKITNARVIGESLGGHAFALPTFSRYARTQTIEVTMSPIERATTGWVAGGVCIYQDGGNFWRLALVESPDERRYAELVAMSEGIWQAQAQMKLKVIVEHAPSFSWSWWQSYRMRIILTEDAIDGQVLDSNGNLLWRRCYALNRLPIVRSGWMALNVQGMRASFGDARQSLKNGERGVLNLRSAIVIRDKEMGNLRLSDAIAEMLNGIGIKVTFAGLDELAERNWWQRLNYGIIALPNARRMPIDCKDGLLEFLECGGKLIAFGMPMFEEVLSKVRVDGKERWMTNAEINAFRKNIKPQRLIIEHIDDAELKRWVHAASHPGVADRLAIEPSALKADGMSLDAMRIEIELKGWGIFLRSFEKSPFKDGHTLTCFWAKGAPQTKSLMIEWREFDGSRWYAHVPLSTEWKLIVLSPYDFTFRGDSPTAGKRGFAGDYLKVENARTLVLGMEGAMPHGKHTIFVAGIGTAREPVEGIKTNFAPPSLEALSPAYKFYPVRNVASIKLRGIPMPLAEKKALKLREPLGYSVAPVQRHIGIGFIGERPFRYVPLTEPPIVWLMLNAEIPYPGSWWLCFGSSDEMLWLREKGLMEFAKDVLSQLIDGAVLIEGGTDRFTAYEGEGVLLGFRAANFGDVETAVNVRVNVMPTEAKDKRYIFSKATSLRLSPTSIESTSWKLPKLSKGRYLVIVELLRKQGVTERVCDRLISELVVIERPKVTDADKIVVRNGHFVYRGRRWFAFGLNYWPRFIAGQELTDYGRHWLHPVNYDPTVVEEDLHILKSMGMNCVSVSFHNADQAMPLRDFLRRCHEHGIKVNLFISGAHPLGFNPDLVRQLIEAADLPNQPALFAYDIAWEPHFGGYSNRRVHDTEWQKWLVENYGNIEVAERDFGFKLPRDENGNVTVPRDEHLLKDGEWRIMAAAYRRFLDDFISRRYRKVCQFIRSLDTNHLIGARTGYGGGPFGAESAFPFDHTSGAKHLDFISPEGWNLGWLGQADEEQFARAAFITAYSRWAGNGKPVFWAEFGLTIRHGAFSLDWYDDEERLQAQAKLYDAIYKLIQITDADGAMGWWFPGGYRVNERSDFGIINPDGTLRPAAMTAKKWAKIFQNMPEIDNRPVAYIKIDRDENARGPMALWLKYGDESSRLIREGKRIELRTDGSSKTSDDVIELAIGNTKWQPLKPPKFINGEINTVYASFDCKSWQEVVRDGVFKFGLGKLDSDKFLWLKVELGNVGEAAWLPPNLCKDPSNGIIVLLTVNGKEAARMPIPKRVDRFEDVTIEGIKLLLPKDAKALQLEVRLLWRNSPFGERFSFQVM